jgi:hypothetical protein
MAMRSKPPAAAPAAMPALLPSDRPDFECLSQECAVLVGEGEGEDGEVVMLRIWKGGESVEREKFDVGEILTT